MKFQIKIYGGTDFFRVQIFLAGADTTDENNCIWNCGWKGDEFEYENKRYSIIGPYHDFPENESRYCVYELVPVSELSQ